MNPVTIRWSNARLVSHNGRMVMTLYFDARKATLLERLHEHRNIDGLSLKMDETLMSKLDGRNLHIVVLESFLNPE